MTISTAQTWKTYGQARKLLMTHCVKIAEVPTDSYVSYAMPTRRWNLPTWACFSGSSLVRPVPQDTFEPNRWWAVSARSGRLVAYVDEKAVSAFSIAVEHQRLVSRTTKFQSIDEVVEASRQLERSLDLVVEHFFDGRPAPASNRKDAIDAIQAAISANLINYYEAFVDDFIGWLTAG
jgi:hypothetical protein